jgi:hypothetical protein
MSVKWSYSNKHTIGIISVIYCYENPSIQHPTGLWKVVFKNGKSKLLNELSEPMLFYYEDKNAYSKARINSEEVARKFLEDQADCFCTIM